MRFVTGHVSPQSHKYRAKDWGYEYWTHNDELYCSKILHFNKLDSKSSMHFHMEKTETMTVTKGRFGIKLIIDTQESEIVLIPGDWIDIHPGTPHQIVALEDHSEMIESSTMHKDSDSYRIWRD